MDDSAELLFIAPPDSHNIYEILLDNIYGNVIIKDKDSKVLWVNKNARVLFAQHGIKNPIGLTCDDVWPGGKEAIEKMNELDAVILETGESIMGVPLISNCSVEENVSVLYRVDKIPYMSSEGIVQGVVTFMLDTTHALDYQIKKYIDDITYHELRSRIGNILKNIEVKTKAN